MTTSNKYYKKVENNMYQKTREEKHTSCYYV